MSEPPLSTESHTCPSSSPEDPVDFPRPLTSSSQPDPHHYPQIALPCVFASSRTSLPPPLSLLPSPFKIPFSRPPSPGPFPKSLPFYKPQLQAFCLECQARLECKHQIERPWTELEPSGFHYEDHYTLDDKHNPMDIEVCASQGKELFKPRKQTSYQSIQSSRSCDQYSNHSNHSNNSNNSNRSKGKGIADYSLHGFRYERSPFLVRRKRIRRVIQLPLCHQAKIPSLKPPSGSHEDDALLFDLLHVLRSKEVRVKSV
jgi:hypothetical protein